MVRALIASLHARPHVLLTMTMFMWACNAIAGQFARGEITPVQHVLIRWMMVTALMWPLYGRQALDFLPVLRRHAWKIAAMAMLGFTGFNILFYVASFNTTAVNVGILQGSIPMIVAVLAFLIQGSRITVLQGLGILITLVGVAMVATRGLPWLALGIALNFGDAMMLLACLSYSTYAVLLQGRPAMPAEVFFTLMAPIAMLTAIPPVLWEAAVADPGWPTWKGWLITAFVALFPGTIAQLFFVRAVDLIGPARAGAFNNLVPVFASVLAVLILGEAFAWYHAAALVLVLGGIAMVQLTGRS